jgi:hypothetical protein
MSEPTGAIFFWKDEPNITGYLTIGRDHYELVGVKRSNIRTDFRGRKITPEGAQTDIFDGDGSGDGAS